MFDPTRFAAGRTHRGMLRPDLSPATELPYAVIRGAADGPTLLLSAGVHGAEYASIEAAYRAMDVDPATLRGTLVVVPILCPPSFFARTIYVNPVDGKNLNRQFPGDPNGTFSQRLAHWFSTEFIAAADAYVDLHGGDLIEPLDPFTLFVSGDEGAERLARAFGIPTLIASEGFGSTITAAAARGVPAILPEASGQGLRPEAEVDRLARGVTRAMAHLGMRHGEGEAQDATVLQAFAWLRAEHDGLWYPTVTAGQRLRTGQAVGTLRSLLGEPLQEAVSPIDGHVLFGVSSLAINQGEPLAGIGA